MKEGSDVYTLTLRHRTRFEGVESRGQDIESLEVVPRELNSVFQLKLKSKKGKLGNNQCRIPRNLYLIF